MKAELGHAPPRRGEIFHRETSRCSPDNFVTMRTNGITVVAISRQTATEGYCRVWEICARTNYVVSGERRENFDSDAREASINYRQEEEQAESPFFFKFRVLVRRRAENFSERGNMSAAFFSRVGRRYLCYYLYLYSRGP